jgi:chemotaxis methyl-accepting protein methylase
MNQDLIRISDIMRQRTNRDVSTLNVEFFKNTINERQEKCKVESLADYIKLLENNDEEIFALSHQLNNTTSQFFRDELTFSLLEHTLLPHLMIEHDRKREIRVWSAGCALGQEPYSISILLEELQLKLGKHIPYRIFGTDISEQALIQAKKGIYDFNSVEKAKLKVIERYFTIENKSYLLKDSIRNHVSFSQLDLGDEKLLHPIDCIYGGFDVIFCCNVLIYYQPKQQKIIINKLIKALAVNGFLILGEAERLLVTQHDQLKHLGFNTAVFQMKARKKE